jgi:two-component system response regulator CpxR
MALNNNGSPLPGASAVLCLDTGRRSGRLLTAHEQERTSRHQTMRPRKVILLVDGNEQCLSVRKFMLETRGYRVVEATGAEAALERFAQGGIDLVLSDLLLPGMDGNEMVRRMKAEAPEVPALLVSGTVRDFARAEAADAFLPKGAVTPSEMVERIRVLLVRKRGPKRAAAPVALAGYANAMGAHA